jgi:hypothetical protein
MAIAFNYSGNSAQAWRHKRHPIPEDHYIRLGLFVVLSNLDPIQRINRIDACMNG